MRVLLFILRVLFTSVGMTLRVPPEVRKPDESWRVANTYLFGGLGIPVRYAEYNTCLSGGIGTGKTTALIALMVSRIQGLIESGKPFNVHCFTPRPNDFFPLLKVLFEPLGLSVRATNPFITDSWAWDGSLDLCTSPSIDELTTIVIKDDGKDASPFFKRAAALILKGVVLSLATNSPGIWRMKHVVSILRDVELIKETLGQTEQTKHLVSLLSEGQGHTAANLHATLLAELKGLELIAALIDDTLDDRRFSIRDAANKSGIIWVHGSDPRYASTIEPWNGVQFELLSHELLIRGDIGVETCLFIDEFTQLGGGVKLTCIRKLLEYGRANRVRCVLAVQTPAQVVSIYGEHEAETILGQCHCFIVFKHSDNFGRTFWSRRFGQEKGFEEKHARATQTGGGQSTGQSPSRNTNWSVTDTVSIERFDLPRVPEEDIGNLPVGSYEVGMFGYACIPMSEELDPKTGFPEPLRWKFRLTPEWIALNVPRPGAFVPYEKSLKPVSSYTMDALEPWEFTLLGLTEPKAAAETTP